MSELAIIDVKVETQIKVPKSLREQRQDLRLRLQLNRRLLAQKLIGEEKQNYFPRSATMRFLSRQSTHQLIHKAANAALGLQTFKTIRYGYTAVKFLRGLFNQNKKTVEVHI